MPRYHPYRPPARSRRVYLRFTEHDYALLQRICVVEGLCVADLAHTWVGAAARKMAGDNPGLQRWWAEERDRIDREERQHGTAGE